MKKNMYRIFLFGIIIFALMIGWYGGIQPMKVQAEYEQNYFFGFVNCGNGEMGFRCVTPGHECSYYRWWCP
jgi:hypothetical protein